MKRLLLLNTIIALTGMGASAQTTYGGAGLPVAIDGGYISDYQPSTTVLTDGSVSISDNGTYEHGNTLLQIDGSWNSTSGGTDLFVANGTGTIAGSVAPNFFNVHFNTGSASVMNITNAQGANVAGQLQFANGITTTTRSTHINSALRFADGATYSGGNSDSQHVNGYVTKTGGDPFVFPIGSGTDLRTLAASGASVTTSISAAWFTGSPSTVLDPTDGSTHDVTKLSEQVKAVLPVGFWDWVKNENGTPVQVIASIPDISTYSIPLTYTCLAGWDGNNWVRFDNGSTITGQTENSTITATIPAGLNLTALAIGDCSPLPVRLVSFEGKAIERRSQLNWTTTEEVNASHFDILRSNDGNNFAVVGTVEAKGESSISIRYEFLDAQPDPGTNYYRLKQVDNDGTYTLSKIIHVRFDDNIVVLVYPNPASDIVHAESTSPFTSVELFDVKGMKIEGGTGPVRQTATQDKHLLEINLRDRPTGIYVLKVNGKSYKIAKN